MSHAMDPFSFTNAQRRAIESTGCSVIVSAAAGSGKTAVLAERCAYLICDAPPDARCDVDQLLVLTFTEAAASEMRSRIVAAIRLRAGRRPHDRRLHRQIALVDAAHISTVHSFCLWLVRRWFSELGIDPSAAMLDEKEAVLMKRDVLDTLFNELYPGPASASDRLGRIDGDIDNEVRDSPGARFVRLIDDYGLGEDRAIAAFVLKLHEFTSSLPDPNAWLRDAVESLTERPEEVIGTLAAGLRAELDGQVEHCTQVADALKADDAVAWFFAEEIQSYVRQLVTWRQALNGELARYKDVCESIRSFAFSNKRGPKVAKDADPKVKKARESARGLLSEVRKQWFGERIKKRYALFSLDEWIDGLRKTAPYVRTLVERVTAFREAYSSRKRRLGVLDFADLERFALRLLQSTDEAASPSPIAHTLHRRFVHVLVDEFQDINPVQEAILRLASHESDPNRPGNLFVVGDVKQSIYRFRLAEPRVFTERLAKFVDCPPRDAKPSRSSPRSGRTRADDRTAGVAIHLQENFRSQPVILDAINLIFGRLMRGSGAPDDIVYDRAAELRPGRAAPSGKKRSPVELHVLERAWGTAAPDEPEGDSTGGIEYPTARFGPRDGSIAPQDDPARRTPIEREAFLIGSRIRDWMASGESIAEGQSLRYRDVAVLLRAARINAEQMAAVLTAMQIPAYADVGGSLFATLEIRDVLAALRVLDNVQQDIPLAAVLRSGVLGEALSDDDLVEIRCLDRSVPFHAVVREYVHRGGDSAVRGRLETLLRRIDRYRRDARRRPLADVLWRLYEEQGYLAYAGGLPDGPQRRANLLKLHELARKFGAFRRQGLHRFLRFVQSLEDEDEQVEAAPAVGEAEDVVRIMSIHRAKGLEFPVVFVAGLGTRFNLGDRSGRMIFERRAKIGLRVVDPQGMVEYPSAAHQLVAMEVEQSTRAEELRILYVAFTRARDRLVLVGSMHNIEECRTVSPSVGHEHTPSRLSIATAGTPLDWLMAVLAGAPVGLVQGWGAHRVDHPVVDVHVHEASAMAGWRMKEPLDERALAARREAARRRALPEDEPHALEDAEVEQVLSRLEYVYPWAATTSVPATVAAGQFKGVYDYTRGEWAPTDPRAGDEVFEVPPSKYSDELGDTAASRGTVTHRVLQHLDWRAATDAVGVASELRRMVAAGHLTIRDCELVEKQALEWLVTTPLAQAIRKAGDAYRREFPFIAAESPGELDRGVESAPGDFVLVRGIVDGILPVEDGVEIVDFKTDAIRPDEAAGRAERYRPQMTLYARAMTRIWRKPVKTCRLVFLAAKQVVDLSPQWEEGLGPQPPA